MKPSNIERGSNKLADSFQVMDKLRSAISWNLINSWYELEKEGAKKAAEWERKTHRSHLDRDWTSKLGNSSSFRKANNSLLAVL